MKNTVISREDLMEKYSNFLLTEGERPKTVYAFANKLGITEHDFYIHFGGFLALERVFFTYFLTQSIQLTEKIKGYKSMEGKERLLNFYYILYENLNMNRSLVLLLLGGDIKSKIALLKPVRSEFLEFVQGFHFQDAALFEKASPRFKEVRRKSKEEALWLHFLSVLKFWQNDESSDFEKTDIYIEKSMEFGTELLNNSVVGKFLDLSKFLWNERF